MKIKDATRIVKLEMPTGGASSDVALKKNIAPIQNVLEKVLALRPVTWNWRHPLKDEPEVQYGFIAQEVEQLFPDMVSDAVSKYDRTMRKHLTVVDLVPHLVEALKEQQKQIDALEERLKNGR